MARDSGDSDERVEAVRTILDVHDASTIDLLLALLTSPHHEVRGTAVHGLSTMVGAKRAHEAVPPLVADRHHYVREVAALSLAMIGDPAHADAILRQLQVEDRAGAAFAQVAALLQLDPERGLDRIKKAMESAGETTRAAVDQALAALED